MDPRPVSSGRAGHKRDSFRSRWKTEAWLKVGKVRIVNAVNLT